MSTTRRLDLSPITIAPWHIVSRCICFRMLPRARLSGQTHYVHEASGKRSFTLPGSQMEPASEQGIAGAGASGSGRNPPQQGRAASHARGRYSSCTIRWHSTLSRVLDRHCSRVVLLRDRVGTSQRRMTSVVSLSYFFACSVGIKTYTGILLNMCMGNVMIVA